MPVYNEGSTIARVLRDAEASVRTEHEVFVVYDFEGDTTVPVVRSLQAEMPRVLPLKNGLGPGALYAIKEGMAAA